MCRYYLVAGVVLGCVFAAACVVAERPSIIFVLSNDLSYRRGADHFECLGQCEFEMGALT